MDNFFAELRRRHIYRVGAGYVVVAWALTQVIDILSQVFALPPWIGRPAILLLAAGFPVMLLVAWVVESKPQKAITSAVRSKDTAVDWVLSGALALVIALIGYQQLVPSPVQPIRQSGVEEARAAAALPAGISVVVLPFLNLSPDPDQEYFADGMTEEITSVLAKIPDLRVVARTSAFQFREQNRDIQKIGEQLHATHFIEGSVRKAGDRVRITAQLIEAKTGVHVWANSYDRELTDVFDIQEDIARAIATSLNMQLGLTPGERLVNNRTNDLKAYEDFLRARVIGPLALTVPNSQAILEEAVARDPNFAPAWASLASRYSGTAFQISRRNGSVEEVRATTQSFMDKAEMAARKAIELDSRDAAGYGELGLVQARRGQWTEAETTLQQALALDPDNPDTLRGYLGFLVTVGRLKEALRTAENLLRLEPFVPLYNFLAGNISHLNGQDARATAILEAMPANAAGTNYLRNYALATVYAAAGQYEKAADTVLLINTQVPRQAVEEAARLLRTAPLKVQAPQDLPALQADLNFVYAYVGAQDRIMENPERSSKIGMYSTLFLQLWDRWYAPLRKMERFKSLMREAGLVNYWKARGWPDLCHPTTGDDFECS